MTQYIPNIPISVAPASASAQLRAIGSNLFFLWGFTQALRATAVSTSLSDPTVGNGPPFRGPLPTPGFQNTPGPGAFWVGTLLGDTLTVLKGSGGSVSISAYPGGQLGGTSGVNGGDQTVVTIPLRDASGAPLAPYNVAYNTPYRVYVAGPRVDDIYESYVHLPAYVAPPSIATGKWSDYDAVTNPNFPSVADWQSVVAASDNLYARTLGCANLIAEKDDPRAYGGFPHFSEITWAAPTTPGTWTPPDDITQGTEVGGTTGSYRVSRLITALTFLQANLQFKVRPTFTGLQTVGGAGGSRTTFYGIRRWDTLNYLPCVGQTPILMWLAPSQPSGATMQQVPLTPAQSYEGDTYYVANTQVGTRWHTVSLRRPTLLPGMPYAVLGGAGAIESPLLVSVLTV